MSNVCLNASLDAGSAQCKFADLLSRLDAAADAGSELVDPEWLDCPKTLLFAVWSECVCERFENW
jgi:hypothetical protein